ncbi:hypothetical protein [Paenibacillus sp. MBLB4367]|uniref:hypothetical protein n=1 Tax=Paenibacillus sp. MBLB4367 TaxID=3384767 RepID=UPI00390818F8
MSNYRFVWPLFAFLFFFFLLERPAEASVIDRIKDIYSAPEKVDELRKQYEDTIKSLEQQQQKLQEAQASMEKYAAEQRQLMEENNRFRQQKDELQAQNAQLTQRLEQLEQDKADKKSLYRRWMSLIITAVLLAAGYVLSIRVWRYAVWRRQRHSRGGVIK